MESEMVGFVEIKLKMIMNKIALTSILIFAIVLYSCQKNVEEGNLIPVAKIPIKANVLSYGYYNHQENGSWGFHDGLALFQDRITSHWGFIDTIGEIAINPVFTEVEQFSCGIARVEFEGTWTYIDKSGNYIFGKSPDFKVFADFHNGIAPVKMNPGIRYIKKNGEWLNDQIYDIGDEFSEGLAAVNLNTLYGFIDTIGELKIPYKYYSPKQVTDGYIFSDGAALVINEEGKYGYINKEDSIIIPFVFEKNPTKFNNNRALFFIGRGWEQIDRSIGMLRTSRRQYDYGNYGFIDKTGKIVILPKYSPSHDPFAEPHIDRVFYEGYACVITNRSRLFYTEDYINVNEVRLNVNLPIIRPFSEDLARVSKHWKENWGYVDKSGLLVIRPEFINATDFSEGKAIVMDESGWYILKRLGKNN